MENRLTQFPNIYPTGNETTQTKISWNYVDGANHISIETLVLSWAALLQAYTGDEQPVFVVNRRIVKANLAQKNFDYVTLQRVKEIDESTHTAIDIIGVDNDGSLPSDAGGVKGKCSICLDVDLTAGTGILRSEAGISPTHLDQIGHQMAENVQRLAGTSVELDSTQMQESWLSIANPDPQEFPGPSFLHQLAFYHGQRSAPALEFLDVNHSIQTLSFHELDSLSTQLAQRIARALGPPRPNSIGQVVPVLLAQSIELYIAWLAVLKAGAAFCPLSTDAPEDRIRFILKDVSADVIVTHSIFKKKVSDAAEISTVLVDDTGSETTPCIWQEPTLASDDLAYVMYTSGSTGRPKGVSISHRAATQSLFAHNSLIPPFRRFLQFASPTFDVSVFEVFFPWFRGVTLVGSERSNMLYDLPQVVAEMRVDAAELTPTVAGELLRGRQSVPTLKVLLTIGEMLTNRVVEEFGASEMQDGILHGMYGPTEATIHCTAAPYFHSQSKVNLIGKPLQTVSAFVMALQDSLQDSFEPIILPIGQIGELVVGGPQLANGYINRPIENSKAFIRSTKYGRLYRTGDKARLLPNGEIECFGRVSAGQIKLRGQRVELGEIESVVSMAPGVRSTVVGVVGGILIAWMLAEEGVNDVRPSDIRRFCKEKLPGYMVPGDFIFVHEFSRLESGKVDRKALEAEYIRNQQSTFSEKKATFRDSLEEKIAEVVSRVVETTTGNLSAAGLDSLRGIKLAACLREVGINLDVGQILSADSVGGIWELAQGISKISGGEPEITDKTLDLVIEAGHTILASQNLPIKVERVELCSEVQVAMLSESLRDNNAYCNWIELKFAERLQLYEIKEAFCKFIENNEMLRSAFLLLDLPDQPFCQVIRSTDDMTEYFYETATFNYDWKLDTETGLIFPIKIQFMQDESSVRTLLHLHHAIYDGWSWDLVLNDLQSALDKKPLASRPPYSTVVKHYKQIASSDTSAASRSYWAEYLRDPVPTRFPNFHGRHDLPKKSSRVSLDFDISLTEVEAQAISMSISRQTIFQASLAFILSSYLDAQDVIMGTVFSGRTVPVNGIEAIVGPCLHILPNRVNLSWLRTVSDLLTVIQRDNRKALENGDLSLRQLKRISGIERNSSLFESLLVWQETLGESPRSDKLFEQVAAADFLEFPLTIELDPTDGKIRATAIFDESMFPKAQVLLLLEQVDAVAGIFIRSPNAALSSVNTQLPSSVLSIENSQYVHLDNLPHLAWQVEQLAMSEPTRNAIEFIHSFDPDTGSIQMEAIDYHQLNSRSNRLARHLLNKGVSSGELVAIILEKSIELYVSILAVVKIGAGYVPLTPSTPIERMRTVLDETKTKVCISDPSLHAEIASFDWLHFLDLEDGNMKEYPDENVTTSHRASNTAYVVYTSGSTGKPKGVVITHHNLQSNIAVLAEMYPVGSDAKLLQACSQAFDVSVFEIFFAWNSGMGLCSATNDIMFRDIEAVIRSTHVTHLSLTPTVAALIRPENVPEVRFLVTAGEGLTAKVHHDWSGKGLYQGYGPCETTNICTVSPNVSIFDNLRNIGKPFKNTSVFVISDDPGFTLLPRGSVGEFCFGGDQVGQEYIQQPELTSEKFIEHSQFGRLYRSGDFGRLLSDGTLIFTGRRDDQVKLRGQRIELGEINSTILRNKQIRDCTSIIVGDRTQGHQQQLISFFVPQQSSAKDVETDLVNLKDYIFEDLSAKLPPYMIPSSMIPVEVIPMTTVKKVDIRNLTERFGTLTPKDLQKYSRTRVGPVADVLNPTEEAIAKIISQATHTPLDNFRVNTSLYSIGLDSISAIYVAKKLRESGFGQVDVSTILRNSSVGGLARAIEKNRDVVNGAKSLPAWSNSLDDGIIQEIKDRFEVAGHKVQSVIPCTALQEAMLSRTVSHDKKAYRNYILLEIYGDVQKLHSVLQHMVERHEILRTCFVDTKDARFSFAQVILNSISLPFVAVETSSLELEIRKQKSIFAEHDNDHFRVPYSFAVITDTRTGQQMLLFSVHHAIHDGEATGILFKEIERAYEGISLKPVPQFHQFVDYILSGDLEEDDCFWSEYLKSISYSYMCPQRAISKGCEEPLIEVTQLELGISLKDFETACNNLSVTLLSMFQASWALLLSRYTLSTDICFGAVLSGRTAPLDGVEDIIGPCFNVLPVRLQLSAAALNTDVVKMAQRANVDLLAHQHTSLRHIQKKFSKHGQSLFDSIVLFQRPTEELDSRLWKMVSEEGVMDFPVILEIIPSTRMNSISMLLHTDSCQIPSADAQAIAKDFVDVIVHTITYPLTRIVNEKVEDDVPSIVRIAREFGATDSAAKNPTSESIAETSTLSHEESLVRDLMSDLSKYDPQAIRHDTTIFQLGLDSINAVQISRTLKDKGYSVSAAEILEKPSMSQIADLVHNASSETQLTVFDFDSFELEHRKHVLTSLGVKETNIESIRPCSPVQAGMLAEFTESKGSLYCNRLVLKLQADTDISRLQDAWAKVMARHEMLRTGFVRLIDPRFPFAMVTYAQSHVPLPWYTGSVTPSEEEYQHQRDSIYENLHLPQWHIVLRKSQYATEIEFTANHAIYDAQSLELILSDVAKTYEGSQLAPSVPINPILGHILSTASQNSPDAESFWSKIGSDFQATRFPNLTPFNVRDRALFVGVKSASKPLITISQQCKNLGVSLQAVGQAAYARLLAHYTGERNVSFGVVLSGREFGRHVEDAAFPCLVTVPFHCQVQGSNQELISSIMRNNASLLRYQFTPLSKIQGLLQHNGALIDTLFVYQKLSRQDADQHFWKVVEEDARVNYPLSVEMVPEGDKLILRVTCRNDVIPPEQAEIILKQLDCLFMDSLLEESNSTNIPAMQADLLSITPAKEERIPSPVALLHQFVERTAQISPQKTALEFASSVTLREIKKESWTYSELDQMGNKVARLLQSHDTNEDGLVAICFDKCPQAYFAILGILKSGHAYVALDPTAPLARKQFIIEDSGARTVLCASDRYDELQSLAGTVVIALDQPDLLDGLSSQPPKLSKQIDPQDTCYCLYTSGTTGTPKGCEITHENAVQAMQAFTRLFSPHWDEDSRWLQFASFHFDVSVLEQYWSWSVGICVTSCPRDVLFQDLPGVINCLEITHIDLTPSLAKLVTPDEVPSLCKGVFITGGEALKQEILEAWGKHRVIYNGYGPTEVTIGCTMLPRMDEKSKSSNIGPQFDNVGSYVFQPGTTLPVLRGCMGELCVSGALVGRGYLNRPELTRERFQFLDDNQRERVYRTGDLVRILHDGSFQFNGRIDDQVKLRGQRLELGEINAVIQDATGDVSEVATLVIKHPSQQKEQLVVFVSQRQSQNKSARKLEIINDEDVHEFLACIKKAAQKKLPVYMVPTHLIPVRSLPLTPNNKVDTKALKNLFSELSSDQLQNLSALSNQTTSISENEIRDIAQVLSQFAKTDLDAVSPNTSIYDIGLDSISVIGLAQKFRDAGYQNAQVSMIMRNPTIAGIATSLKTDAPIATFNNEDERAQQKMKAFVHENILSAAETIDVSVEDIEDMAPCTPLQEGMIARFLESSRNLYCSSFRFEMKAEIDIDRLRQAWSEAQQRVQLLRVRMAALADGFAQVVLKQEELPWTEKRVVNDYEVDTIANDEWLAWCNGLKDLPSNLWRLVVVKSSNRKLLCLNIFHALYDGNSLPLLLEEVATRYFDGKLQDNAPSFIETLPHGPLRISSESQTFWMKHLTYVPDERLFTEPEQGVTPETISLTRVMDGNLEFEDIKTTLQVTENAIFHACWLLTLHEHFSHIPPLGIVVCGRALDFPGIESVIGPLFNTVPSYIPRSHLKTRADLIRSCHQYHVSVLPFQHTPLREIMKRIGRGRKNALFEILFVFQREHGNISSSPTARLWTEVDSQGTAADFPLALEVRQTDDNVIVTIASQSYAVSEDVANALLSTFERICKEMRSNQMSTLPDVIETTSQVVSNIHASPPLIDTEAENTATESNWTPNMNELRDIVAHLAGVDATTIKPRTSIFELGLDSIDAIKLSSRLKSRGLDLSVSTIMKQQTILRISESLSVSPNSSSSNTHFAFTRLQETLTTSLERTGKMPADTVKVLPLTALQESLVAEMIMSHYQHYYGVEVFEIMSGIDFSHVLKSWKAVINAHPILRTSFVEIDDPKISISYAQVIHIPKQEEMVPVIDLQEQSIGDFIHSKIYSETHSEFAVQGARKDGKCFIIVSMAHALYDGWSLDLLHADVEEAYYGGDVTRPSYEPVLEQILDEAGERHRQFWSVTLRDFKPRSFPVGKTPSGNASQIHRTELLFDIPSDDIKQFCRKYGITAQALSVTTWALTLASFVESLDVGFGLVLSGRTHTNANEVMFPTMNTVVFRSILHGSRLEMLKYVQSTLNALIEHQHYPLRKAGDKIAASSLFDTLFIYQKRPSLNVSSSSRTPLYRSVSGTADTGYPLSVEMELMDESMICRLAARDDLLGSEDAKNILDRVFQVFKAILSEPESATVDYADTGMTICGGHTFSENRLAPEKGPIDEQDTIARETIPWTTTEMKIRQVLSILSGVSEERITKETTLFHLGLDSISAIKVCSLLKKQSVLLTVSAMLKAGSIVKIASAAKSAHEDLIQDIPSEDTTVLLKQRLDGLDIEKLLSRYGISANEVEQVLPVTAGQIYCLARNAQDKQLFYANFYYKVKGISRSQLSQAWKTLTRQIPILRTAFIQTDDIANPWLQVYLKQLENPVCWHETTQDPGLLCPGSRSVAAGPVSLHAVETGTEMIINLNIHHALYDAVSLPKIIDHLGQLCMDTDARLRGNTDYSSFIAFQNIRSPLNLREEFWRTYLNGVRSQLLQEREVSHTSFYEGRNSVYQPGLVRDIQNIELVAREYGLSLQSIFMAVYAKIHSGLLSKTSDTANEVSGDNNTVNQTTKDDFVVGVYLANRGYALEGLQDMVSPTLNMVPLRIARPESSSLIQSAQQIQKDLHEISRIEYSGVSLLEINKWTGLRIDTFVNFLRLPEPVNDAGEEGPNPATKKRFQFIPSQAEEITHGLPVSNGTRANNGLEPSAWEERGREQLWKTVYMNCIDIEAAVRGENLDIGIFGPKILLSQQEAETLLSSIRSELEELSLHS